MVAFIYDVKLEAKKGDHFRFFSEVIKFRATHDIFKQENFLDKVSKYVFQ